MIDWNLIIPVAKAKGHLDQERKKLQSTKTENHNRIPSEEDNDFFQLQMNQIYAHMTSVL